MVTSQRTKTVGTKAEAKGNAYLRSQIARLVSGLIWWNAPDGDRCANPLRDCEFNYLALKLQVLGRLRHYALLEEANGRRRLRLLYICSGADEFCRIVESLGFSVTTVDMTDNEYSRNHIKHHIEDDAESLLLLRSLIESNDFVLWDTSIGHLEEAIVQKLFELLRDKSYMLGVYDVPKIESFGDKVRNHAMMANIIRNSPRMNPNLYSEALSGCTLQYEADLGAFSILLYDNIFTFPLNDHTLTRALERANSF